MIGKFTRRSFLAGALALLGSAATAQNLDHKALLWDIQVGSFTDKVSADQHAKQVRERLAQYDINLNRHVLVEKVDSRYNVLVDANSPRQHIDAIANELKSKKSIPFDSFFRQRDYFYNDSSTQDRFAYLVVEDDLSSLVKKYTTAYGTEIATTVRSLQGLHRERLGRTAKKGDIVPIPVRFLKLPYQLGMTEGEDYLAVTMKKGDTLYSVVEQHTSGNLEANLIALRRFNEISPNQQRSLQPGTVIMVPNQVVGEPLEPTGVTFTESLEARISRAPTVTEPQQELDRELRKAMPSNQKLDVIVNAQNLGILALTNMPAVLTESFNIRNYGQRKFYDNDNNLRALAVAYANGVIAYKQKHMPTLTKAIIDHGHGDKDPGTIHKASGSSEREYTRKIQQYLGEELQKRGITPVLLNYSGPASAVKRVRWYANEANKVGNSKNSIYIATHIDSMNTQTQPLPRVFVHGRGRQTNSRKLAREMLGFAVPNYQQHF